MSGMKIDRVAIQQLGLMEKTSCKKMKILKKISSSSFENNSPKDKRKKGPRKALENAIVEISFL